MKTLFISLTITLIVILAGCTGGGSTKNVEAATENDTVMVPDTGYTGIRQYMSNGRLIKEVTFKNSIRNGLTKTYYQTGELYQTFWYENGVREDTGKLRAKLEFNKGLRTTFLEEYTADGKLFKDYPEIVVNVTDEYNTSGLYRIGLQLSDNSTNVKFFQGDMPENRFDTLLIKPINTVKGKAQLNLKKSGTPAGNNVGVIAQIITPFRNRHFIYKKIDLPYNDLK
jgi:hypothetical protein